MSATEIDRLAIERFVRDELGCTCPAEVFTSIYLEKNPDVFSDLIEGTLLSIGGRLLVYVIEMDDLASAGSKLVQILERGRELRNAGGFNRFRLVVAVPLVQPAEELLLQEFDSLTELDEKLHLHVISNDQLPENSIGKSFV